MADDKVKHIDHMYSLHKVYNKSMLDIWSKNNMDKKYYVEPKYDGCAVCLLYKDFKLHTISTRGDGAYGKDITRHRNIISNIVDNLDKAIKDIKEDFEIRGEVVVYKEDFEEINKDNIYSNTRNYVSGDRKSVV